MAGAAGEQVSFFCRKGTLFGVNIPFSSRHSIQLTKEVETNTSCITVVPLMPSSTAGTSILKSASAPVHLGPSISVLSAAGTLLAAAVHRCVCYLLCYILCSPTTVFAQKSVCKHCECCSVSLGFHCQRDPRQCIAQRPALTLRTVMRIMYPWSLICPQTNQYVTLNCLMTCTL